jgi:hypothetical protein
VPDRFGYPAPRARGAWPARTPLQGFIAYESTRGVVATLDLPSDIIRFSGRVQRVDLRCGAQPIIVTLTDRDRREADTIEMLAGTTRTVDVACTVVRAQNRLQGFSSELEVIGYFQESGHVNLEPAGPAEQYTDIPAG